jgi:hypothetical protein
VTTPEKQIKEDRPASIINASNLAVEYGAFNVQMFSDPCGEIREATEGISISGDQFSLTGFNVSERAKAVNLQFFCGVRRYVALAY